jgi:hypothetical protein
MNSKIVITRSRNSSSRRSASKIDRRKIEDIDLGSTIGDIYRKSRSKSVSTRRNNIKNIRTSSHNKSTSNIKRKYKNYYNNSVPAKPINTSIKNITIKNKSITPEKKSTYNIASPEKPMPNSKKSTPVKRSPIVRKSTPVKRSPIVRKSTPVKRSVPERKPTPVKRSPIVRKSTPVKRSVPERKTTPVKSCIDKKPVNNYKKVEVKTNLNSFEITDNLVNLNIYNQPSYNDANFTQFKESADLYLMKVISGGLDIKKYAE